MATVTIPLPDAYEANKLRKKLKRLVGQALADYGMIKEGDRVMVCVSGGKDSHALLDILCALKRHAPVAFDLIAVNLDQGQPGFPKDVLPQYLESQGVPYRIVTQDTYRVVKRLIPEGKTLCSLCSRLRRGIFYRVADELGATCIALGHHRDDILETFFLNLFHGGTLKAMPPKLLADNGRHTVIRPLAYVAEEDLIRYSSLRAFPIIPCQLCGSEDHAERRANKRMLKGWGKTHPKKIHSMFKALQNIAPSHLADRRLFDFVHLGEAADETI
jgi:tRNA 2-thiocytidine biosynthesis protein TtcA